MSYATKHWRWLLVIGCSLCLGCEPTSSVVDVSAPNSASFVSNDFDSKRLNWPVFQNSFQVQKPSRVDFLAGLKELQRESPVWVPADANGEETWKTANYDFDEETAIIARRMVGEDGPEVTSLFSIPKVDSEQSSSFEISPNGKTLAIFDGKELQVWGVAERKPLGIVSAKPNEGESLRFAPDSNLLLVAEGAKIRQYELTTQQFGKEVSFPQPVFGFSVAQEAGYLLVTLVNGQCAVVSPDLKNVQFIPLKRDPQFPLPRISATGRTIGAWGEQRGIVLQISDTGETRQNEVEFYPGVGDDRELREPIDILCADNRVTFIGKDRLLSREVQSTQHYQVNFSWPLRSFVVADPGDGGVIVVMDQPQADGSTRPVVMNLALLASQIHSAPGEIPSPAFDVLRSDRSTRIFAIDRGDRIECLSRIRWPIADMHLFNVILNGWATNARLADLEKISRIVRSFPQPRMQRSGEQWFSRLTMLCGSAVATIEQMSCDSDPESEEGKLARERWQRCEAFFDTQTEFSRAVYLAKENALLSREKQALERQFGGESTEEWIKSADAVASLYDRWLEDDSAPMVIAELYLRYAMTRKIAKEDLSPMVQPMVERYAANFEIHEAMMLWLSPWGVGDPGESAGYANSIADIIGGDDGDLFYAGLMINHVSRFNGDLAAAGVRVDRLINGARIGIARNVWARDELQVLYLAAVGADSWRDEEIRAEFGNAHGKRFPMFRTGPGGEYLYSQRP